MDRNGIARVQQRGGRTSVFAQYTVFLDDREQAQERLKQAGIPTAVHYPFPLNQQAAYMDLCCAECTPHARGLAERVMSLPMGAGLISAEQSRAVEVLKRLRP